MVKNVRRGDTVVTSGGLIGKVTKVIDDEQIEVELADERAQFARCVQMVQRRARQGRAGEGRTVRPRPRRCLWLVHRYADCVDAGFPRGNW